MKKVMLSLITAVVVASMFFSCTEEEVKPSHEGTRTESNKDAWN